MEDVGVWSCGCEKEEPTNVCQRYVYVVVVLMDFGSYAKGLAQFNLG